MIEFIKRIATNERAFAALVIGVVAALVQAEVIAAWSTLVAVGVFTPVPMSNATKRLTGELAAPLDLDNERLRKIVAEEVARLTGAGSKT